ncbi:hypothetical protein BJX70DRAFT_375444 [Aspergillus crustosus]
MAAPRTRHVSLRQSIIMLMTILTANASPSHGLSLHSKRAGCSSSSQKCSGAGLPDNFCCSSTSTCVSVDSGSSVVCCPEGQDCSYIEPITCDVIKQNASLHPNNVIKTTRLDDDLPTCGDLCCPFGYSCQGSFCALDDRSSSTTTRSTTTEESTTSPTSTKTTSESTDISQSATTTTAETTSDSEESTTGAIATITSDPSPTIVTLSTPTLSQYSAASDNGLAEQEIQCPAFPTNAVLAGFFPGSVFGAVAALLLTVCIRRKQRNRLPPGEKIAQITYRNSTGTLMGISEPIASDESSFRTDFLLRTDPKRHSEGARSVLQRSRSRVKSLFGGGTKAYTAPAEDIPAVPPVPIISTFPTTPRQRQPSTESIRVYTPPSVFSSTGILNPTPYPDDRPNTTLTEILDRAQAQMEAQAASTGANSKTNSTATSTNQRFLLPPPQQSSARRKPLPY